MVAITLTVSAILAIVFGVLVLSFPKFLRYAVGFYLIITGILQLINLNLLLSP